MAAKSGPAPIPAKAGPLSHRRPTAPKSTRWRAAERRSPSPFPLPQWACCKIPECDSLVVEGEPGMAIKRTGQFGFVEALLSTKGGSGQLDRLHELVKWYRFAKLIGHLRDAASPGRPGYPVMVLFKAVLLQSLYGLSER